VPAAGPRDAPPQQSHQGGQGEQARRAPVRRVHHLSRRPVPCPDVPGGCSRCTGLIALLYRDARGRFVSLRTTVRQAARKARRRQLPTVFAEQLVLFCFIVAAAVDITLLGGDRLQRWRN
jgi:hypothetical protein